ncbi:MAG: DUF2344 domain-containing protein, partial [Selenomonas sp.]|nr:DUF2344 domain-containing protein [Selenomonas sp.]
MDVKLEDDSFDIRTIPDRLNSCLPRGIRVFDATEVIMKAGKVAYASFTIRVSADRLSSSVVTAQLRDLLGRESIEIEKK